MASAHFNHDADLKRLQRFLVEMRVEDSQAAYFHYGDLLWRIHYAPNQLNASADIRIWSAENGEIDGFVFYLVNDNNPEFFLRPSLYESKMADEMIEWAKVRAQTVNAHAMETGCVAGESAKEAFLKRHGFVAYDEVFVFMARSLADQGPTFELPADYSFVSNSECDLPGVTGTAITREQYAEICRAPGYRDDLGLRVCYKNREIVAGCICWFDDLARSALFEPVGTVAAHRGKGLALAVMAKTLANLRAYEAENVYVRTHKDNIPAVRLYEKLGFEIGAEENGWKLAL